jgi:signal transduction histidine kinase
MEMKQRIALFDWARTPLGPAGQWPQSLRSTVKTLLASRYPMILTWGPGLIQIYNDAYSKLIGDKHPAALGTDIRITMAEAWGMLGPLIQAAMTTGEATWVPALLLVLERSGYREESYFSVSHAPAEDDEGRIAGMLAVCSEVTQQVLGERRLRLLRDLASQAGDMRSSEETCRDLAAAIAGHPLDVPFAQIYLRETGGEGLVLQASVGIKSGINAGIEEPGEAIWPLEQAVAGATVRVEDVEHRVSVAGGPWGEAVRSALVMPIASTGNLEPLGVLVAGISPNRALDEGYSSFCELLAGQVSVALRNARAYEEERGRAEMLAEIDRAKTMFFSNVSHELRTPLTLMLGPLEEALRGPGLPEGLRDQLQMAHRNSLRLLKLVNTLLDFSRIEAGRTEATYEPTDLAAFTADLASVFRSGVERAGLRLEVDCPPLPEPVWVDRDLWEKIVLNLLSNAFKFTEQGRIAVRQTVVGRSVELAVEDTGCGIPASELGRVFERFHRIEGTRGRTHEGTGIGLSLVQELVRLHGGTVRVESSEGRGSTFTVSIPLGREHLPADRIGSGSGLARAAGRPDAFIEEALRWLPALSDLPVAMETVPAGARARVLLADDNADMREYVQKLLSPRYEVITVSDGEAAWAAIEERQPELVLSDVMMPRLDGFGLLQRLRSTPSTRSIPVVLLSARAGEESRVVGLEAGADDYLVKPFSARELLARVKATLELARLREETSRARTEALLAGELLDRERAARNEAEKASRLKDEFLSTVSHELRTPLNAVLGWAQLLRERGIEDPGVADGIEVIERNTRSQVRLIEDLLDMGRILSGTFRLDLQPLDLGALLEASVASLQPTAELKGVRLRLETPVLDPGAGSVTGDPSRLQQVVVNLLSNAIKFTPEGGEARVSLVRSSAQAEIRVSDTGVGIEEGFLPYVFERFRQEDGSTTRRYGGLGLGLSIVKHLVELHGGSIRAESGGRDQGATFTVSLPLASEKKRGNPEVPPLLTAGPGSRDQKS